MAAFDLHLSVLLRHSTCCSTQTTPRGRSETLCLSLLGSLPEAVWFIPKATPPHSQACFLSILCFAPSVLKHLLNWTATEHARVGSHSMFTELIGVSPATQHIPYFSLSIPILSLPTSQSPKASPKGHLLHQAFPEAPSILCLDLNRRLVY